MMLHVSGTAPAKARGRVPRIRPYDKADGKSKKNSPLRPALPEPVRRTAPALRAQYCAAHAESRHIAGPLRCVRSSRCACSALRACPPADERHPLPCAGRLRPPTTCADSVRPLRPHGNIPLRLRPEVCSRRRGRKKLIPSGTSGKRWSSARRPCMSAVRFRTQGSFSLFCRRL